MPVILDAMPEGTYRRVMTPELEHTLADLGEVIVCRNSRELSEEEYSKLWERADAVLSGWGIRPPTPAILDKATNLKVISHTAGSVKMFPRYTLEKGILITSAQSKMARTVAEFCLMNALILLRRLLYYVDASSDRKTYFSPEGKNPLNETLYGKTVGLVGFGHIGKHFRELLAPFGCRVLVYDPYLLEEAASRYAVELTDLHTLLKTAPIVSLHVPDIPSTQGMIGAEELALLSEGAVLLNSSRGRVVDTEALTSALQTRRIYAAIDVTYPEPLPLDHPLRFLPNVLFTPHVAGPTEDELPVLSRAAIEDMRRVLRGEAPLLPISLEVYDLMSF